MISDVFLLSQDLALTDYWKTALQEVKTTTLMSAASLDQQQARVASILFYDLSFFNEEELTRLARGNRVIALSLNPTDQQGLLAMHCGCQGFCHAYSNPATLKQVIAVVEKGGVWMGESLLARLLTGLDQTIKTKNPAAPVMINLDGLTARESEVAAAAARGMSNKAIANTLDITERTVKAHLTSTFAKLGIHDRLQLALRLNGLS